MKLVKDIVLDEFGEEHVTFRNLLLYMFKIDPNLRPSAKDCLQHPFFNSLKASCIDQNSLRPSASTEKSMETKTSVDYISSS